MNFEATYCIAQNGGGVKLWQIGNFKNLAGKTLANCNKLSSSFSIKTCHWYATLNLKPQSFILSSRVALKYPARLQRQVWWGDNTRADTNINMLNLKYFHDRAWLPCEQELINPIDTGSIDSRDSFVERALCPL